VEKARGKADQRFDEVRELAKFQIFDLKECPFYIFIYWLANPVIM